MQGKDISFWQLYEKACTIKKKWKFIEKFMKKHQGRDIYFFVAIVRKCCTTIIGTNSLKNSCKRNMFSCDNWNKKFA